MTDDGDDYGCDCGGSGGSHSVGSDRSAYDGGHQVMLMMVVW